MELRQLEQLDLLYRLGSVSKVAKAVFLTQPSVSRSLSSLEKELGLSLFERTSNKLRLTPNGERLAKIAGEIINRRDAFANMAADLKAKGKKMVVASICSTAVMGIIPAIRSRFGEVNIDTAVVSESEAYEGLDNGKFDMAIVSSERAKGYSYYPLFSEHVRLSVPPGHRFYDCDWISFSDIDSDDIIMYDDGGAISKLIRDEAKKAHLIVQTDLAAFKTLVENTSLPYFTSNLLMKRKEELTLANKRIPIKDTSAHVHFRFAVNENAERLVHQRAAIISSIMKK